MTPIFTLPDLIAHRLITPLTQMVQQSDCLRDRSLMLRVSVVPSIIVDKMLSQARWLKLVMMTRKNLNP